MYDIPMHRFIGWFVFDCLGLLGACIVTLCVVNGYDLLPLTTSQQNTLICGILVFVSGTLMMHKQRAPFGFRSLGEVIPVLTSLFGIMVLAIVIFRIDYSRSILLVFVLYSIVWFQLRLWVMVRYRIRTFWVIPQGNTEALRNIRGRTRCRFLESAAPRPSQSYNDGIVTDLQAPLDKKWSALLVRANLQRIPIYDIAMVYEALSGRVSTSHLCHSNLNILLPPTYYLWLKRLMDILYAATLLVLFAPLMLLIVILIQLDSPGKILFVQKRLTLSGRSFNMFKFRTMNQRASEKRYAASTKSKDKRVTRIGGALRRFRLDELPQLFNVLKGEMSIVGPRPAVANLNTQYIKQIPFYQHRHIVRPGITGWAQISQGYALDEDMDSTKEKIERDLYYIKHLSLWLDVMISAITVVIVLSGRGAR